MGTEFLHPRDCLTDRMRVSHPAVYSRRNPNTCRQQAIRQKSRKRSTDVDTSRSSRSSKSPDNLVMGQVTILKRGESLDGKKEKKNLKKTFSGGELVFYGTERLGPEPDRVPKIRISDLKTKSDLSDEYAGSACFKSPSPRLLPLPKFSLKRDGRVVDDSATKDLRRLLRLD